MLLKILKYIDMDNLEDLIIEPYYDNSDLIMTKYYIRFESMDSFQFEFLNRKLFVLQKLIQRKINKEYWKIWDFYIHLYIWAKNNNVQLDIRPVFNTFLENEGTFNPILLCNFIKNI